jgi:hypothetical protein
MKGKKLNRSRNKRGSLLWMVAAACLTLTGCARFGPILLNKAVIQYDASILQSEEQLLLLNIIRMHDDQPPHFTVASNILATFRLSHTGGLNPSISGTSSSSIFGYGSNLTLGKTVSDEPTITIAPLQGKDYAQRLLKSVDTQFVNTILLQRGGRILIPMLRLIGRDFLMIGPKDAKKAFESFPLKVIKNEGKKDKIIYYHYPNYSLEDLQDRDKGGFTEAEASCLTDDMCFSANRPWRIQKDEKERIDINRYKLFRKIVLHIRAMALSGGLFVSLQCFDIPVDGTDRTAEDIKKVGIADTIGALEKQYHWEKTEEGHKTKPGTEKEGFILTNKSNPDVEDTFIAADDLKGKGKDMKDIIAALEGQYHWNWKKKSKPGEKKEAFKLTKRYPVTALTDFDLEKMAQNDKKKLLQTIQKDFELDDAAKFEEGMIIVLFRGYQDGWDDRKDYRWPIYGYFSLRNFRQVLQFLSENLEYKIGYEREYDVAPSGFTSKLLDEIDKKEKLPDRCLDNPSLTLTITSKKTPSRDRFVDVDYNGELFWISSPSDQTDASLQPTKPVPVTPWEERHPERWDKEVFSMLYEVFQFNRIEPPVSPPLISITK